MKSKALLFLPLTFLAGTHGFALFAPYVALVLAVMHLRGRRRVPQPAVEPLPVPVPAVA